ncbi:hypothetical protein Anas_07852 [Armadillidium nasatum]|uniref:Uncharacterized protein n=1 Tax=Armadillidium nasatum TaxID=96803 RepID=A0A5N5SLI7_9CRUS|nr:hypothetical protein Anas_07852 [Armadillidium nasatum]
MYKIFSKNLTMSRTKVYKHGHIIFIAVKTLELNTFHTIINSVVTFVDVAASQLDLPRNFEQTQNEDPLSGRKYDGESIKLK